jgi:hypothetical protein
LDKSNKKLKIGHVQDSPVATTMISNECMVYLGFAIPHQFSFLGAFAKWVWMERVLK